MCPERKREVSQVVRREKCTKLWNCTTYHGSPCDSLQGVTHHSDHRVLDGRTFSTNSLLHWGLTEPHSPLSTVLVGCQGKCLTVTLACSQRMQSKPTRWHSANRLMHAPDSFPSFSTVDDSRDLARVVRSSGRRLTINSGVGKQIHDEISPANPEAGRARDPTKRTLIVNLRNIHFPAEPLPQPSPRYQSRQFSRVGELSTRE